MSSQAVDRVHPILDFAQRAFARLTEIASVPAWSMSEVEQRETLVMLARAGNQLDALKLRVLAEADRSGATDAVGAGSAADWVAVATRQVRREARAELRLAKGFDDHPALAAGCEAGEVNLAQARAIATAIDRLPTAGEFAVTADQRRLAEEHMVALAAHHDAKDLAVLGRKLFEVIAPELADAYEGKQLEKIPADDVLRAVVSVAGGEERGRIVSQYVIKIPATGGWRLGFEVESTSREALELRAYLDKAGSALTETWSYTVAP